MAQFETLRNTLTHTVLNVEHLTDETFSVKFTRGNLDFQAGQHICVGPHNDLNMREYSIYSGTSQDFLEILVKEIQNGYVSKLLKQLQQGQSIKVEGPFGYFTIEEAEKTKALYGIATGTGIAPFHCFAISHPQLSFSIVHGIRHRKEQYHKEIFENTAFHYTPCISREKQDVYYQGRVTDFLKTNTIDVHGIYFLCGNCDMIYEVFDILQQNGVPSKHIKAEVYF